MSYRAHVDYKKLTRTKGKRCSNCGHPKKLTDFNRDRRRHDGRHVYCRDCVSKRFGPAKRQYNRSAKGLARAAAYRARNPEAVREQSRRYRAKLKKRKPTVSRQAMDAKDRLYPSHFVRND